MKPTKYAVVPQVGRYIVQRKNGSNNTVSRVVTKDKKCSCGGSAENPCSHIEAVKAYLMDGGERAEAFERVMPDEPGGEGRITVCPICETEVRWAGSYTYPLMWRCPKDSSHYWRWLGEKGAVKKFLTEHRTGIPAIDMMTVNEYKEYLDTLERERYGNCD